MSLLLLVAALAAGLPDRGIFADLDERIALAPPTVRPERARLRLDPAHGVLTLYDGDDALKAYPARPSASRDRAGDLAWLGLRDADREELRRRLLPSTAVRLGAPARDEDRDGDGIVDPLDVLLGARKLLENRARYEEHYRVLRYPGGDVPRTEGVCTDTVVRAFRNGGIDLQREVHEDVLRAPRAYPMVRRPDANIDHRRVRTLLPWFARHAVALPPGARFLPGDVVFFDTFPSRPGPDHIGIVSDTMGPNALPLVINNWTEGAVDAEMDLLPSIPVTHHFRLPKHPLPK